MQDGKKRSHAEREDLHENILRTGVLLNRRLPREWCKRTRPNHFGGSGGAEKGNPSAPNFLSGKKWIWSACHRARIYPTAINRPQVVLSSHSPQCRPLHAGGPRQNQSIKDTLTVFLIMLFNIYYNILRPGVTFAAEPEGCWVTSQCYHDWQHSQGIYALNAMRSISRHYGLGFFFLQNLPATEFSFT